MNTVQTILPTADFDTLPAEVIIDWKSGRRFSTNTSVRIARGMVNRETKDQKAKRIRWIKVTIPNPECTKAIVCIFEPKTQWTKKVIDLPATHN